MLKTIKFVLLASVILTKNAHSEPFNLTENAQLIHSSYDLSSEIVNLPKGTMEKVGHFSVEVNDYSDGNSTKLSYQTFPWLQSAFQYDTHVTGNHSYQYNLAVSPYRFKHYPISISAGLLDVFNTANQRNRFVAMSMKSGNHDISAGLKRNSYGQQWYGGSTWRIPSIKSQLAVQYAQHQDSFENSAPYYQQASKHLRTDGWQLSWEWYLHPNVMLSLNHNKSQTFGLGVQWRADLHNKTKTLNAIPKQEIIPLKSRDGLNEYIHIDEATFNVFGWILAAKQYKDSQLTLYISEINNTSDTQSLTALHQYLSQSLNRHLNAITYIILRDRIPIYKQTLSVVENMSQRQHIDSVWQFSRIKPITGTDISSLIESTVLSPFRLDVGIINRIWLPEPLQKSSDDEINKSSSNTSLRLSNRWQWAPLWDVTAHYEVNLYRNMESPSLLSQQVDDGLIPHRTALYYEMLDKDIRLENMTVNGYYPFVTHYQDNFYLQAAKFSLGRLSPTIDGISIDHTLQSSQSNWSFGANAAFGKPTSSLSQFMNQPNKNMHALLLNTNWTNKTLGVDVKTKIGRFIGGDNGAKLTVKKHLKQGWNISFWYTVSIDNGQRYVDKGIHLTLPLGKVDRLTSKVGISSYIREISGNSGYTF